MITVDQGQTVTLDLAFLDDNQNPVDVSGATVSITDPLGNPVASGLVPTATGSTGAYEYQYAVPLTAALGVWSASWSGTSSGSSFGGVTLFNVIGSGGSAITTWTDVQTYTGKTFSVSDQDFCTMVIAFLQDELETHLGRPVTVRWFYDLLRLEENQTQLFLKQTPILTVKSVEVEPESNNPQTLDPNTYNRMSWGVEVADPTYQLLFRPGSDNLYATVAGTEVGVTYQAGLDGPNIQTIRALMVRAASREWLALNSDVQNVSALRAGTMMQWTFADGNRGGFSADELKRVSRFKRRRAS